MATLGIDTQMTRRVTSAVHFLEWYERAGCRLQGQRNYRAAIPVPVRRLAHGVEHSAVGMGSQERWVLDVSQLTDLGKGTVTGIEDSNTNRRLVRVAADKGKGSRVHSFPDCPT